MKAYTLDPDEVMFTSDHHFGHSNIIKYCSRPFTDVHHMNVEMTKKWNEAVRPDQTVFHLGDFSFGHTPDYLDRLNGNVILIRGNHDKIKDLQYFHEVHDLAEVIVGKQRVILCHYRMDVWNQSYRGAWHLHGHSHGRLQPRLDKKVIDIGVDSWKFSPVTFWEIEGVMEHHGQE